MNEALNLPAAMADGFATALIAAAGGIGLTALVVGIVVIIGGRAK